MMARSSGTTVAAGRQPKNPRQVNNWLNSIQEWIFPPTCLLCGDRGHEQRDLCRACLDALPRLGSACTRCGLPVEAPQPAICGNCLQSPLPFDRLVAAFRWEQPVSHLVRGLKFRARYAHARLLGSLLAEAPGLLDERPEVIVPVPLHTARYRERGFNQALEIARVVSRYTGIPLDIEACQRTGTTLAQSGLQAHVRRQNIRGAFTCPAPLPYHRVTIVDDVVTTGATVSELARTLRRAGVGHVDVWCCARALR